MIVKTKLLFKNLRFHAFHGALPQERIVGGCFLLNMEVTTGFEAAMQSDKLCDTVDYGAVYELVREEMQKPSKLLEHVAGRICNALFQRFAAIQAVHLTLLKETPPVAHLQCGSLGVEVEMSRNEVESESSKI